MMMHQKSIAFFTDVTKHSPPLVLRREPGNIQYLDPLTVSRNKGLGYRVGITWGIGLGRDLFEETPAETHVGVYRARYC